MKDGKNGRMDKKTKSQKRETRVTRKEKERHIIIKTLNIRHVYFRGTDSKVH